MTPKRERRIEELAVDPDPFRALRAAMAEIPDDALARLAALRPLLEDVGVMLPAAVNPHASFSDITRFAPLKRFLEGDAWLNRQLDTLDGGAR